MDTGWLLCGTLHSRAYWDDADIRKYATELLNRADWQWMLNGRETLSHGWAPESGIGRLSRHPHPVGVELHLVDGDGIGADVFHEIFGAGAGAFDWTEGVLGGGVGLVFL